MNLKMKVKSYSFWVSLASALILILKLIGQKFGFTVDETLISDLFTSLCAILVILGIIVVPSSSQLEPKQNVNIKSTVDENKHNIEIIQANEILDNEKISEDEKIEIVQESKVVDEAAESVQEDNQNADTAKIQEQTVDVVLNSQNLNNQENIIAEEVKFDENFNLDIQSFIDKVCLKRAELNGNVANFVEFLQNELNVFKKDNN